MRRVWTRNHYTNRIRDDGPTGTIELEQVWRVRWKVGDAPPEQTEFGDEEQALMQVEFRKAKLGGTWESSGHPG